MKMNRQLLGNNYYLYSSGVCANTIKQKKKNTTERKKVYREYILYCLGVPFFSEFGSNETMSFVAQYDKG